MSKNIAEADEKQGNKSNFSSELKQIGLKDGFEGNDTKHDNEDDVKNNHPISYMESMVHVFKGNVGTGLYAMGDAFKNGGLILAPILTLIFGIICVHSQHILLKCSRKMKKKFEMNDYPDFADTVELCFQHGIPKLRRWSNHMRILVNFFICITQMGLCSVYFVFISGNLKQIWDQHGIDFDVRLHMLIILIPILSASLIPNLKYMAPCSSIASLFMLVGIGITLYFATDDLPDPSERNYVATWDQLPLFFGTAIFAFEGICLILPLQNAMKKPKDFYRHLGVLNFAMSMMTTLIMIVGFFGYLKYGEEVEGSLTLNIPKDSILGQSVTLLISLGVLLGYPLQFYVAVQIMWRGIQKIYKPFQKSIVYELTFRTLMVFVTFLIAVVVPKLSLFISLIGAVCSSALMLVFPPIIQLVSYSVDSLEKGPGFYLLSKNIVILLIALLGFVTGGYESIAAIVREFIKNSS